MQSYNVIEAVSGTPNSDELHLTTAKLGIAKAVSVLYRADMVPVQVLQVSIKWQWTSQKIEPVPRNFWHKTLHHTIVFQATQAIAWLPLIASSHHIASTVASVAFHGGIRGGMEETYGCERSKTVPEFY